MASLAPAEESPAEGFSRKSEASSRVGGLPEHALVLLEGVLSDFVVSAGLRSETHWLQGRSRGRPGLGELDAPFVSARTAKLSKRRTGARSVGSAPASWDTRDSVQKSYRGHAISATSTPCSGRHEFLRSGPSVRSTRFARTRSSRRRSSMTVATGRDTRRRIVWDPLRTPLSSGSFLSTRDRPSAARGSSGATSPGDGGTMLWAAAAVRFWVIPRGFTVWKNIRVRANWRRGLLRGGRRRFRRVDLFDSRVLHTYGFGGRRRSNGPSSSGSTSVSRRKA